MQTAKWAGAGIYNVYVEDGKVIKGTDPMGKVVYPYKYYRRFKKWKLIKPKLATLRVGLTRGNYKME